MKQVSTDRRRVLSFLTMGLLTAIGVLLVTPVVAFVVGPLRKGRSIPGGPVDLSDAGPISTLPLGQWTPVPIEIVRQDGWAKSTEARSVWVLRSGTAQQDFKVLSPICTHLGCPVAWQASLSKFRCPCHGGTFSNDGTHISGPPPRNMDSLDFELRGDHLWVLWQDFQIGTPERVPVQV
jgi:menaquinol-cytochrome c reductase iron-sulfur subunit